MNSKTYSYYFTSTLNQASIHMKNRYSTTSTDPNHMHYYLDSLGNMTLNKHHSRDFFEKGIVVDNKNDSGMSVRDKRKS